jgi:hypothetical protein
MTSAVAPGVNSRAARPPHARLASAAGARAAIAAWLLDSGVQQTDGAHAGAVAGWIDARGAAQYVYPEITGYYLQWLASHALRYGTAAQLIDKAAAAQRWLGKWSESAPVLRTRVYLDSARDDWRNGALFFFDLTMVLRGLAWASRAGLIRPDQALVSRLCQALGTVVGDDGIFYACVTFEGDRSLTTRWSTRRGPFLAKAAAGILFAADELPEFPAELATGARHTLDGALTWIVERPHVDTHPFLYAIEGLLSRPHHRGCAALLPSVALQFRELIDRSQRSGHVPESIDSSTTERLDIVAQAVRIGCLLRSQWLVGGPERSFVSRMARLLVRHTTSDGALPFDPRAAVPQYSAWGAMFAEQALFLVDRAGNELPQSEGNVCVV